MTVASRRIRSLLAAAGRPLPPRSAGGAFGLFWRIVAFYTGGAIWSRSFPDRRRLRWRGRRGRLRRIAIWIVIAR